MVNMKELIYLRPITDTTMAFIVPVMKKDFILYNTLDRKKDRANSNPIDIRTTKNDNNSTRELLSHE